MLNESCNINRYFLFQRTIIFHPIVYSLPAFQRPYRGAILTILYIYTLFRVEDVLLNVEFSKEESQGYGYAV